MTSFAAKPPSQAPRIAGAPAIAANVASRGSESERPSSAAGAAIPSPSVMLWIMKPTTRNEPSVSCPKANDVPIASPSPKLCSPIPIATSVASATPPTTPPPLPEKRPERGPLFFGPISPQGRQPEQAERDGQHADEEADDPVAEESTGADAG